MEGPRTVLKIPREEARKKAMQYLKKVGLGEIFENGTPEEILVSPKKRRTKESLSGHDQFQIPSRHMT